MKRLENEFSCVKEARRENKGGFDKINMKIAHWKTSIRIIDNVLFGKICTNRNMRIMEKYVDASRSEENVDMCCVCCVRV